MKALILAGGRGKRLEGISERQNKCMLKLAGKPLIEYNLDNAKASGVNEIVIVVGYCAETIINTYGNSYHNLPVRYVIQNEQRGLVHAMECSRKAIGGDDFLLLLGDEFLFRPRHQEMISHFNHYNLFGICGVVIEKDINRISRTYAIFYDNQDGRIWRLIEKPRKPGNNIMGTGNCIFKNAILNYIDMTPINHQRGEKELPDLIQCAIDDGNIIHSFVISERYANINTKIDLKEIEDQVTNNAKLLISSR